MITIKQSEKLKEYRRYFHRFPEPGYLEMKTTIELIKELKAMGFENISYGKKIHSKRIGLPSEDEIKGHAEGLGKIDADFDVEEILQGYTGLIVDYDTGRSGPKIGFRFEIDGLKIEETRDENHLPNKLKFRSENNKCMHACGHDAHMAIGLGLADYVKNKKDLKGSFRFIFQPAEEGVHGAKSMVDAGAVDGLDYVFGAHIGIRVPGGVIGVATDGFLATEKFDIDLKGRASHAGILPERGRNALLGAASLTLTLHSLPQHSKGLARVNVGVLRAGSSRNIIAEDAHLEVEIRGESDLIVKDLKEGLFAAVEGTALAYGLEKKIETVGGSIVFRSKYKDFAPGFNKYLEDSGFKTVMNPRLNASEDICYMLNEVEAKGGKALHFIIGSDLAASHHNGRFDISEDSLELGFNMFTKLIDYIYLIEEK